MSINFGQSPIHYSTPGVSFGSQGASFQGRRVDAIKSVLNKIRPSGPINLAQPTHAKFGQTLDIRA